MTAPTGALGKKTVSSSNPFRLHLTIRGAVQGVGFRPFVYRLATELQLSGWVNNSAQGVFIEVEGTQPQLETFVLRIEQEKPPLSIIHSLEASWLDPVGYANFEIRASVAGEKTAVVLPDIATCPDCLREIFDRANRRYRYPFTNCTNCGPRYTIIEALPYDRCSTTMRGFTMCPQCQAEYENPLDRRFHAQPNACPVCGPHLEVWDSQGNVLAAGDEALTGTVKAIREGKIAAVKGLGGFHLIADACSETAVRRLRDRKRREEKPFALMYPSLELVKEDCSVSPAEARLLRSPESPIVLLQRKPPQIPQSRQIPPLAPAVAPGNPYLGVMLPYTPLHHLLMAELGAPVVATSGNLSDEPICTNEREALERLSSLADIFLIHDRAIVRPVDDSVVRLVAGREMVLRRARGYAPLPISLKAHREEGAGTGAPPLQPILAVGAHLKNAIALSLNHQVFISQHIGDLETPQAFDAFDRVIASFKHLYDCEPATVACDAHPDYKSSHYARELNLPTVSVQHHYAHVLACMAENQILGQSALGIAWDGTGYGLDGTIWGGEFLLVGNRESGMGHGGTAPMHHAIDTQHSALSTQHFSLSPPPPFHRVAHFRTFRLPGGDKAVKEPRRSALGLLYEVWGDNLFENRAEIDKLAFSPQERKLLQAMLQKNLNAPVTSSAGRLFDGIAALIGLRQQLSFEGQAAMQLEFALDGTDTEETYPIAVGNGEKGGGGEGESGRGGERERGREIFSQSPLSTQHSALSTQHSALSTQPSALSTQHSALSTQHSALFALVVDWSPMLRGILEDVNSNLPVGIISAKFHNTLVEAIAAVAKLVGVERIVLTGGCFQNRYLTEKAIRRLQSENFRPYWHQRVPPNDGGIALGQIVAASFE